MSSSVVAWWRISASLFTFLPADDCLTTRCLLIWLSTQHSTFSESESELHYKWRSVSQYVLVSSPSWDFWPEIFLCYSHCPVIWGRPLWREVDFFVIAAAPCFTYSQSTDCTDNAVSLLLLHCCLGDHAENIILLLLSTGRCRQRTYTPK
jgi:hypothetical protein